MPTWKKVIVSGSNAHLTSITASNIPSASNANFLLYNSTSGQFTYLSTSSLGNIQGRGTAGEVTFWDGTNSITGSTNFLWNNNSKLLTVSGSTTLGNASSDSVTVNAQTVTLQNPLSSTANVANVLVLTSSNRIATQSIDTRVFGTTLIDGTLVPNRVPFALDANTLTDDGNFTYNSTLDILSINGSTFGNDVSIVGDLEVKGGDITTTATTATIFNSNATTLSIGSAATSMNIGAGTGITNVKNNLVVAGDLTVNGTTTTIDTSNLTVEDKFIILAHGSGSTSPMGEGGIIVEGSTADRGQAFIFNSGSAASTTGRWGLAADVHMTSSDVTPTDFMVSAYQASGVPSAAPTYGGSLGGYGNIYVNSADESIWIFS